MSIFDRGSLDASSLSDLHAIASELSIDGYRRLRKADLIEAILERQSGEVAAKADAPDEEESEGQAEARDEAESPSGRRRRGRRGGRGRGRGGAEPSPASEDAAQEGPATDEGPPTRASS